MRTAFAAAVAAAVALPTTAHGSTILRAAFTARSYRPGDVALLRIVASPSADLVVQVFRAGGATRTSLGTTPLDRTIAGVAVSAPRRLQGPPAPWTLHLPIGNWPSGVYVARLITAAGDRDYAPFVLRPARLGAATRVLVVEPTNTWQAYNFYAGDSWYENGGVHAITLDRPYLGDGLPPHFLDYDLGFLRWYARSGYTADFVADDDLARFVDGAQLRRLYDLVVFPGHEEYVTGHVYDVVEQFRNRGGNLAFLSADNFFYAVQIRDQTMVGRTRWRDLGRPEAALVGGGYVGWDERQFANRPYEVESVASAAWLFAGSGLHYGSRFGDYGIEIDEPTAASPPGTRVLCRIADDFGAGVSADMTYYRRGHAQVFDAGVINFGASADWPVVSTLVDNLWRRLR